MLKNYQDFVFFVDSFKFELHVNLKITDARNLSFILSVDFFVLDLCNIESSFSRSAVSLKLYKLYFLFLAMHIQHILR